MTIRLDNIRIPVFAERRRIDMLHMQRQPLTVTEFRQLTTENTDGKHASPDDRAEPAPEGS